MLKRPDSTLSPVQGRSVRFRLLAIALLPMLVILPLLLGVAVVRWNEKFNATLISKVNGDLTIAHQYLARILEYTSEHLQALGLSARFRDVVGTEDNAEPRLAARRQPQDAGPGFSLHHERRRKNHRFVAPDFNSVHQERLAGCRVGIEGLAFDRHRHLRQLRAGRHRARPLGTGDARTGAHAERGPDRPEHGNPRHGGSFGQSGLLGWPPAGGACRRPAAEPESRVHRYDQRSGLSRRQPPGRKSGDGDAVPGRRANYHQCAPVRGAPGARHAGVQRRAVDGARSGQDLARQRLRRQRLVHLGL